jgi:hypothetical protein
MTVGKATLRKSSGLTHHVIPDEARDPRAEG